MRRVSIVSLLLGATMAVSAWTATAAEFITILDENVDEVIKNLKGGEGTPSKSTDAFSGSQSLYIGSTGGDGQKFNDAYPGWSFKIVEKPAADAEFRYITFAWKKDGGEGLQLQLHGVPDTWGHRYHAGKNVKNWNPSKEAGAVPTKWTSVTKDLFTDWKAFTLTGIAYSAWDGKGGLWDAIFLHKSANAPTAVEPIGKATVAWGELKASR